VTLREKKLQFAKIALKTALGHLRDLELEHLAEKVEVLIAEVNQQIREMLPDPEPGLLNLDQKMSEDT
jgi:hypothetical protein